MHQKEFGVTKAQLARKKRFYDALDLEIAEMSSM
jgi:hypothetical protein